MWTKVIGIGGRAGSGKSSLAEAIVNHYCDSSVVALHMNFADPLKDICATAFGLARQDFDNRSKKDSPLPVYPFESPREIMHKVGSTLLKSTYPGVWLNNMTDRIRSAIVDFEVGLISDGDPQDGRLIIVISDVRFESEINLVDCLDGTTIKVTRLDADAPFLDQESGIDRLSFDMELHNTAGSAEEFGSLAVSILVRLGTLPLRDGTSVVEGKNPSVEDELKLTEVVSAKSQGRNSTRGGRDNSDARVWRDRGGLRAADKHDENLLSVNSSRKIEVVHSTPGSCDIRSRIGSPQFDRTRRVTSEGDGPESAC